MHIHILCIYSSLVTTYHPSLPLASLLPPHLPDCCLLPLPHVLAPSSSLGLPDALILCNLPSSHSRPFFLFLFLAFITLALSAGWTHAMFVTAFPLFLCTMSLSLLLCILLRLSLSLSFPHLLICLSHCPSYCLCVYPNIQAQLKNYLL